MRLYEQKKKKEKKIRMCEWIGNIAVAALDADTMKKVIM